MVYGRHLAHYLYRPAHVPDARRRSLHVLGSPGERTPSPVARLPEVKLEAAESVFAGRLSDCRCSQFGYVRRPACMARATWHASAHDIVPKVLRASISMRYVRRMRCMRTAEV